jgi:hypothetical protein
MTDKNFDAENGKRINSIGQESEIKLVVGNFRRRSPDLPAGSVQADISA